MPCGAVYHTLHNERDIRLDEVMPYILKNTDFSDLFVRLVFMRLSRPLPVKVF
jgi:hypothetical protein